MGFHLHHPLFPDSDILTLRPAFLLVTSMQEIHHIADEIYIVEPVTIQFDFEQSVIQLPCFHQTRLEIGSTLLVQAVKKIIYLSNLILVVDTLNIFYHRVVSPTGLVEFEIDASHLSIIIQHLCCMSSWF